MKAILFTLLATWTTAAAAHGGHDANVPQFLHGLTAPHLLVALGALVLCVAGYRAFRSLRRR